MNRAEIIHTNFIERVSKGKFPASEIDLKPADVGLVPTDLIELFDSQITSRLLDLVSRRLSARGESYYTIGSSGHEGNAAFARAFRLTDMAFLHYRSCAFMIERARQAEGETPIYDALLSFAASSEDQIAGGRHKVLGSKSLNVPPQTSTIASHLPKAMGAAHSIGLSRRQRRNNSMIPNDSVIICNFGDASANHSTTQGAINTAGWASYQGSGMPIVFICEDNGIGISTRTPPGWIAESFKNRAGIKYLSCDGLNILDAYRGALEAANYARKKFKPVFLHTRTIRLAGHAGSDVETSYSTVKQLEETEAQDPLLHTANILVLNRILTQEQIVKRYEEMLSRIERISEIAIKRPKIATANDVMKSIVPAVRQTPPVPAASQAERDSLFARNSHQIDRPQHMARLIGLGLADIMLQYENTVILGEDVADKGGVYGVTQGLVNKFGPARVLNTPLDEQSILGLGIGLAHNGYLPIPEIQFLAYVHNAEDQIRGEAATLPFFSDGQYTNPMVVRIAGLAYQKGFGGHFHNDNSFNIFRDIPGVIVACPSNGKDAVQMMRTCVKMAHEDKRLIIFIEPIALYMTRDLHEEGDGLWTFDYEPPEMGKLAQFGEVEVFGSGKELCIVTYGNGYYLSRKAEKILKNKHGIKASVIDLRWLSPLPINSILKAIKPCKNILIVDECRKTGSLGEGLVTALVENDIQKPIKRVTAEDSFIPLAAAANLVLPDVEGIIEAAISMVKS